MHGPRVGRSVGGAADRGPAMDLRTLRVQVSGLTREDFAAEHPYLYLVVNPHPDESASSYWTVSVDVARKPARPLLSELELVTVAKAAQNPYPDRISAGRARNCDVVLRYSSVSKLHAHFRKLEYGVLELVDLGSQNGTMVNGRRLEPNQPERVVAGDILTFGAITAQLVDAELLFDMIRQPSIPVGPG
jgi:hypothetical protein